MTYRIQYLAEDGEWRNVRHHSYVAHAATSGRRCERVAKYLSRKVLAYRDVPIRTLYGESLSPVTVYVNGVNVLDAYPHLAVTV